MQVLVVRKTAAWSHLEILHFEYAFSIFECVIKWLVFPKPVTYDVNLILILIILLNKAAYTDIIQGSEHQLYNGLVIK